MNESHVFSFIPWRGGPCPRYQDTIVERIENRVAAWTHLPVVHQEDMQILRYGIGQQYKVHADTLVDADAGVRVATVRGFGWGGDMGVWVCGAVCQACA